MKRFFIKITNGNDSYRKLCFYDLYKNMEHIGDLIFRYMNQDINQDELRFLKNIDCTIHIFDDQFNVNEVIDIIKNEENNNIIQEIDAIHVNGDHRMRISKILLPKVFFKDLKISDFYYIHIEGGDDYDFLHFESRYKKTSNHIQIYCRDQFHFIDKNDPTFYEEYDEWVEENIPYATITFGIRKEVYTEDYDDSKTSNYIYFTLKKIFKWLHSHHVVQMK